MIGGLSKNNNNDRRVVHTKNINRRRRPNCYTLEGSLLNITSKTVHYLYRRVDYKYKQITLFEISFLILGLGRCEGVSEDTGV